MSFSPAKALDCRVIMLAGDEEALRRRGMEELWAAAGIQKDDFDLEEFDAGSSSPLDWVTSCGTAPFLGARRVAIVRHLLRCEIDRLKGIDLKSLPDTALLVLIADEESGDESRLQRLKTVRGHWIKAVQEAGGYVESFPTDARTLSQTIKKEAERLGAKISDPAIDSLAEMTGGSLSRAVDELQKVALYVGQDAAIRESDVRAVVVPSREWNVFKLVDALLNGQTPEALRQLRILVSSPQKAEEAAFRSILPQLSRNLKLLWQARVCLEAGVSVEALPDHVKAMFPSKPNLTSEKGFVQSKIMRMAKSASFAQIAECLHLLNDADARLKGLLPGFSGLETLERLVLEMSEVFGLATPARRSAR